ncbi:uncharacterized protein LOC111897756 [Lactuca sativa]|uniref:uncharacterized protein LOC111897756 n=1 Tax=Lactuca sativa TaxID=4236 RepID=UPI0022AEF104|nr:uncharacterized protein LOC111897756 [Lactuca sativa]
MKSISGRRLGFPIQFRPVLTDIPSINNHHYRNALCLLSVQICHLAKVFRNPWKIAREINQKNGDGERSTSLSRYRQKPKACVKRVKGDQSGEKHSNSQIFKLLNLLMFPMMLVLLGDRMLTGLSMILDIWKVLRLVLRERMNPISLGHSIPRPRLWLSF